MTNEHLDVVGKTTWDAISMHTEQQISATDTKHDQLVTVLDKHIEGLRTQFSSIGAKADDNANRTDGIGLKLDQLEQFIRTELLSAMTEQTKKTTDMESSLKEIQNAMSHVQLTVEKLSASNFAPHHPTPGGLPTAGALGQGPHTAPAHSSYPALTSFYGNQGGREEHSSMPPLPDRNVPNNFDSHGDARGNYGNNWHSHAWNGRASYHGRNRAEATPYASSNPYHPGYSGQYNTGFVNGYSSYNLSPATPEQSYAYGQKSAQ